MYVCMYVCMYDTLEQRWEILRHYFENQGNVAECVRKLRTDFGRREAPSAPHVHYLVKKMKETGILIDKPRQGDKQSQKQSLHPRILLLWQKVYVKRYQLNQFTAVLSN